MSKNKIKLLITIIVLAIFCFSLFITNLFYPIKYFSLLFVPSTQSVQKGKAVFKCYSVGQADCSLIIFPDGKSMLLDGGSGAYLNTLHIMKDLKRYGIKELDYVVLTSYGNEHSGGLSDIISIFRAKNVYLPYYRNSHITTGYHSFYTAAKSQAFVQYIQYGMSQSGENWGFNFISPSVMGKGETAAETSEYEILLKDFSQEHMDNCSAVLAIKIFNTDIIFCGDVRTAVLESICKNFKLLGSEYYASDGYNGNLTECNILKVPIHGHKRAMCAKFYDLLTPELCIISTGDNNAECPHPAVLSDAENSGEVLVTADTGDITIEITEQSYSVRREGV